ncbi:MAG: hypothetical protein NC249_14325, partial [Lachnoclostridium sp.]|nr:hypothetical protein [Lachnoclostridium sp.]
EEGDDILYGEEGDDRLYGGNGDDYLCGGKGDDWLEGGNGADTYFFGRGDGRDTISEYDTSPDNTDILCMDAEAKRLQFTRAGADLLIAVLGTDDSVTIRNWYYGDTYHVEGIRSGDGYALAHEQIDRLIQAMASFEAESGMSWQDAVEAEEDTVNRLVSQMWVKDGV